MRRSLLLGLLGLLVAVLGLAGCSPAPDPPVAQVSPAASAVTASPTAVALTARSANPGPEDATAAAPARRSSPARAFATATPSVPIPSPTPSTAPASPTPALPPPTPGPGARLPVSLGWRFDSGGHLTAGLPAQLAGTPGYLVASLDRTVSALDGTGKLLWRARTAGPAYALALLDGEQAAVGDDAGQVLLLNAQGRAVWRHNLGSRVTALHSWQDGLLAGGWDERLTWLVTGQAGPEVRWQAGLGGPVSAITTLPGLAVAATLAGEVRAFHPTGAEAWRFDAGAPVTGLGPLEGSEGSVLLVGLQDGRLLALDAGAGPVQLRWERGLGQGGPVWRVNDVSGDPAPEVVFGMGGANPVLGLLSAEGDLLWRVALSAPVGAVETSDLDGDGVVEILAGLASGEVHVFDAQGRQRSSVQAGLPVWGLAAGTAGAALVLADVAAWQLAGREGPVGGAWLPTPPMVASPPDPMPGPNEGAVLVFLGDVAVGRSMEAQLARYGPDVPWGGLGPLLRQADLAVANLECVLTTQGEPLDKPYLIRAHPQWGQALVEAGIDLVSLANNHALDFGQAGLDETLATLDHLEVAAVGAGTTADPDRGRRPAVFVLNGVRVAVLGYAADRWNGSADVPATDRVAWAWPEAVQADVRAARQGADLVVVLLHAGTEYARKPSSDQIAVAYAAVDAGADLVVGHHPHVTQTVERYKQGLIVYSLGDAVFDIPRPAAMRGHLLRVYATRQGITRAELWPFWIEETIRPRLLDDGQGMPRVEVIDP